MFVAILKASTMEYCGHSNHIYCNPKLMINNNWTCFMFMCLCNGIIITGLYVGTSL